MKTFKLKPEGFNEVRKKLLTRSIPLTLIAATVGLYIASANQAEGSVSTMDTLPLVVPLILVALGFGLFRALKRQKSMWNTYELSIEEETITRTQQNVANITIKKEDLLDIFESTKGHLTLKEKNKRNLIIIPATIENREELIGILSSWAEIKEQVGNRSRVIMTISVAAVGLMLIFFVSQERLVVVPSGIILTLGLLWSFFEVQRSKLVDKKTKRGSFMIFLVLISVIGRLLAEFNLIG